MKKINTLPLILCFCIIFYSISGCGKKETKDAATGPSVSSLPNIAARLNHPIALAADPSGNLFVTDQHNNIIRKYNVAVEISTFAGSTENGFVDGIGTDARFDHPAGITIDNAGNLYVTDYTNAIVRKIAPDAKVTTFAGVNPLGGSLFTSPFGIAVDNAGYVYVAEIYKNRVLKVSPDGTIDPTPFATGFSEPATLVIDPSGNVYVADAGHHRISKISTAGDVTVLAGNGTQGFADGPGTSAQFNYPQGLGLDAQGNIYVADTYNQRIRKVTPQGMVTTVAGNGTAARVDGPLATAQFDHPLGIAIDQSGNIYVAEPNSNAIRKISGN